MKSENSSGVKKSREIERDEVRISPTVLNLSYKVKERLAYIIKVDGACKHNGGVLLNVKPNRNVPVEF